MRRDYVDNWSSYDYGDPYYIDSAYGTGGYYYNHPNYYGPNWSCPGGGCSPEAGYGGSGPHYNQGWYYGPCWQGHPGGSMSPGEWAELMQLVRDTNQCCRRMLEMMQQMHHQQGSQGCPATE